MRAVLFVVAVLVAALVVFVLVRRKHRDEPAPPAPVAPATEEKPLDPDAPYWTILESTAAAPERGTEAHVAAITAAVKALAPEEIVAFDAFVQRQLARAYRWDLWAVAYLAMGGCGDDGFEYFRAWLVAQGKDYFERALRDPERAADRIAPGDEAECESLLYVGVEAYEARTGKDLPPLPSGVRAPIEPAGEPWDEADVGQRYPALARRFGYADR